ncbi:MAG: hypothetical protein HY725_01160 [Candidatus Rokubacteria bacterium]|nr:hypothetical protein [Candidatus Rokubacteria bacterium]
MNGLYRGLTLVGFWLGLLGFVVAVILLLGQVSGPFRLTPAGVLRGAQTLFLLGLGAYCAARLQKG